jgi:hypothetical protein
MAEFSKQYREAFNFDWHDFDYAEICENLKPNQFYPLICEGLGTLGVGKSEDGQMLFAIQEAEDPDMVIFKSLDEVIELVQNQGRGE